MRKSRGIVALVGYGTLNIGDGFRYFFPCTHYGGFSRNSSFVHPELSKMIGLRGSFRDLTTIKADFLGLLTHLRQTGLSPIVGV